MGLRRLGYDLQPSEVAVLMQQLDVDADGAVDAPGFVASQLDWGVLQSSNRCVRRRRCVRGSVRVRVV